LSKENRESLIEEDRSLLYSLEEKVGYLLTKYQEVKKEREDLATALNLEREKVIQLEKKLESLSQDREKVKGRIDQLLQRLKGLEV
jgi:septal ring factor EnvC (AmiA/AmiB activator)